MTLGRVGEKKLGLWGRIKRVMLTDVGALVRGLKAADLEQIEQLLIEADFGVPATMELVDALEQGVRSGKLKTEDDVREALVERLVGHARRARRIRSGIARATSGLTVILVVGVNGVGKTTTVAKLARRLKARGPKGAARGGRYLARRCRVAAADLGRPGRGRVRVGHAGRRSGGGGVRRDRGGHGARARHRHHRHRGPAAHAGQPDGRAAKVVRVVTRKVPGAPHETLLVLDGTVGQNAIQQGRLFGEAVQPTGIIVTKLDGTARGGAVAALRRELGLPIRFVGLGEGLDDLEPFDARGYAEGLLTSDL